CREKTRGGQVAIDRPGLGSEKSPTLCEVDHKYPPSGEPKLWVTILAGRTGERISRDPHSHHTHSRSVRAFGHAHRPPGGPLQQQAPPPRARSGADGRLKARHARQNGSPIA